MWLKYSLKADYRNGRIIVIGDTIEEKPMYKPYFYAMCRGSEDVLNLYETEEVDYTPVVLEGEKYVPSRSYRVYKVYGSTPREIPRIAEVFRRAGCRAGGFNVRYTVRMSFDILDRLLGIEPLYKGYVDEKLMDKLSDITIGVFDIEVVDGKPLMASVLDYRYGESPSVHDVLVFDLRSEADEFLGYIAKRYRVLAGYNIMGYDIPYLKRSGIGIDEYRFALFDVLMLLNTYGNALKIGSQRSLLNVAKELAQEVGITPKEIGLKESGGQALGSKDFGRIALYNANDVVLTAKLMNVFWPFAATVSAMTLIPIEEAVRLPSGMAAEYFAFHKLELEGYIPEYRETNVRLTASRVWLEEPRVYHNVVQLDVKMMYPSYVLARYIDPTLHVTGYEFDPGAGPGLLYKIVKELVGLRKVTKKLKKTDERFTHVDAGIKSILNALAYGVYAKASGPAIMGNPWCPAAIFYGTYEAQMDTIRYLRGRGYRVVYSDTDSFFISFDRKPSEKEIEELISIVNGYLSRWGLEVDLEGVWDKMIIYAKKNYILIGDRIVVKGSALLSKMKYGVPEIINAHELITMGRDDRLRYIIEKVSSAPVEDLFVKTTQQVWRLFLLDKDRVKRSDRSRYMYVYTPWEEPAGGYLKKVHPGQYKVPWQSQLLPLGIINKGFIDLSELIPFDIIEAKVLPYANGVLLYLDDEVYYVNVLSSYYVLEGSRGEIRVPTNYSYRVRAYRLKGLRMNIEAKPFPKKEVPRIAYYYIVSSLKEIGLLG